MTARSSRPDKGAFEDVDEVASKLHLPESVSKDARAICSAELRRRSKVSRSAVIAASIYAACRKNGVPATMNEIGRSMNPLVERAVIAQHYRKLCERAYPDLPQVLSAQKYLIKIASAMRVSDLTLSLASEAIMEAKKAGNGTLGRHPGVVAAAALYLASLITGEPVAQRRVTSAAGLSDDSAVREVVRSLQKTGLRHP